MKRSFVFFVIAVFLGLGFSGCAKKAVKTEVGAGLPGEGMEEEDRGVEVEEVPVTAEGVEAGKEEETRVAKVEEEAAREMFGEIAAEIEDVFFDFDRYEIRLDSRDILEKNARVFKKNSRVRAVIEGHADERGTSEYNIALGDSRAAAVKRYLVNLGVEGGRISIVSYGEEKPFCAEKSEECWQRNRRAHFVLTD